eukprot:Hpha_TRINITY_DN16296_c2_g10::TRINITY_DN16296_c2_g10_i2::g.11381::m.11381
MPWRSQSSMHPLPVLNGAGEAESNQIIEDEIFAAEPALVSVDAKFQKEPNGTRSVSLVQIGTDQLIILLNTTQEQPSPYGALARLMADPDICKTGTGVGSLAKWLFENHGMNSQNIMAQLVRAQRLAGIARQKDNHELASALSAGVRGLQKAALGLNVKPPPSDSVWGAELTGYQREYASWEVYAALHIHTLLERLGNRLDMSSGPYQVHIGNLPGDVSSDELSSQFPSKGRPTIQLDERARSTAQAVVLCETQEAAKKLAEQCNRSSFRSRELVASAEAPQSAQGLRRAEAALRARRAGRQVYVGALPPFTPQRSVDNFFAQAEGEILHRPLEVTFFSSQGHHFGSALYADESAAQAAATNVSGRPFQFEIMTDSGGRSVCGKEVTVSRDFEQLLQHVMRAETRRHRRSGTEHTQVPDGYADDDEQEARPSRRQRRSDRSQPQERLPQEDDSSGSNKPPELQYCQTSDPERGGHSQERRGNVSPKADNNGNGSNGSNGSNGANGSSNSGPEAWVGGGRRNPLRARVVRDADSEEDLPMVIVVPMTGMREQRMSKSGTSDTGSMGLSNVPSRTTHTTGSGGSGGGSGGSKDQKESTSDDVPPAPPLQAASPSFTPMVATQQFAPQNAYSQQILTMQATQARVAALQHAALMQQASLQQQQYALLEMQQRMGMPFGCPTGYNPMMLGGMPMNMSQAGMPQAGMPQAGMPQAGMPQAGMPQAGMPQAGMPQAGMPQAGMPQPGVVMPPYAPGVQYAVAAPVPSALPVAQVQGSMLETGSTGTCTVRVDGLPFPCVKENLYRHFSICGEVQSVTVAQVPHKAGRGYASIRYATQDQALAAVRNLDRSLFKGRALRVEPLHRNAALSEARVIIEGEGMEPTRAQPYALPSSHTRAGAPLRPLP